MLAAQRKDQLLSRLERDGGRLGRQGSCAEQGVHRGQRPQGPFVRTRQPGLCQRSTAGALPTRRPSPT
jgi:hypothetical protein